MTTAQDFEEVGRRLRELMPTAEQARAGLIAAMRPQAAEWLPEDFAAEWRAQEQQRLAMEEARRRLQSTAERAGDLTGTLASTGVAASKLVDALRRIRTAIHAARLSV